VIAPRAELEAAVTSALVVLGTSPGVAGARVLSDAEHRALLQPWLGAGDWLNDLPVPRLIEVRLEGPGPDPQVLQARLDQAAPGAIYDGHAAWRLPLERAAAALRRLAWAATALVALAAAAMVALAARASLAANAEVVRVIRLIGAEDRFVEAAFVGRLTARAAAGGAIGALAGAGALALMPELAPGTPMAVSLGPSGSGWAVLLAAVPAGAALVAWLTARHAVRLMLRRMW
jgi:cell division transport system permease protein